MKAILIDPWKRSIEYVETTGKLYDLYQLIGCRYVEAAYVFGKSEVGFVGDESALQEPPLPHFFVPGYKWPLHGRMLVLGYTASGANRSTGLTIEQLSVLVIFP